MHENKYSDENELKIKEKHHASNDVLKGINENKKQRPLESPAKLLSWTHVSMRWIAKTIVLFVATVVAVNNGIATRSRQAPAVIAVSAWQVLSVT